MGLRLHFLSLKARPEAADHEDRLSRSCWRAAPSSSDITTLYTLVSSANIATLLLRIESGRLFTYKKRAGPSIEPRGTPEVTGRSPDVAPATEIRVKPCGQVTSEASIPRFFHKEVMSNLIKGFRHV